MKILVDGYNLAHSCVGPGNISDSDRDRLLATINRFAKHRGHIVQVVFDGGMFSWPETEPYSKRMCVTFSGHDKDADTYLKQILSQNKGKEMVLVTSDNEVARWASRCGMVTIDSEAFIEVMHDRLRTQKPKKEASAGTLIKTATDTDPEVDRLMVQAMTGVLPPKNAEVDEEPVVASRSAGLSKEEKKIQRILDKL